MKYFAFILIVDLISENNSLPWWVHGFVLALASYDIVIDKVKDKK